jgi:hypothetical protein
VGVGSVSTTRLRISKCDHVTVRNFGVTKAPHCLGYIGTGSAIALPMSSAIALLMIPVDRVRSEQSIDRPGMAVLRVIYLYLPASQYRFVWFTPANLSLGAAVWGNKLEICAGPRKSAFGPSS